jgi:hydroxymethylpyrimidine/phosphomethylpyrimidine kinase
LTLWLLGGLDPTGGAGLLRDFSTASVVAPNLAVHCVLTAWTRQGHGAPARAEAVEPGRLAQQLHELRAPRAVKIGLVPAPLVDCLIESLQQVDAPIVVDPVLRASDGGVLGSTPAALAALITRATLVTPNLDEAAALTGLRADDRNLVRAVAERFPGVAVLLKGGHAGDPDCVIDRLWSRGSVRELLRPRSPGPDPRGTGCALATAIACGLGQAMPLEQAVEHGVTWLDEVRTRAVRRNGAIHLPIG